MTDTVNILVLGDIIGKPGRTAVKEFLPSLIARESVDFCIANGENSAGGSGITAPVVEEILLAGVDVITTGNHVWDKKEVKDIIDRKTNILRPANYPPGVPGRGSGVFNARGGVKIGVLNLSGRVFMSNLDCPFRTGEEEIKKIRESTPLVIVDLHAEATAEKVALGWYFDGRVSALVGTHTHVQTADERVLPGKTAYITDIGMIGSIDSVIGVEKQEVIQRFLTQMPVRFRPASGNIQIEGVVITLNILNGKAVGIKRLRERV